jgi:hypothetical protein
VGLVDGEDVGGSLDTYEIRVENVILYQEIDLWVGL